MAEKACPGKPRAAPFCVIRTGRDFPLLSVCLAAMGLMLSCTKPARVSDFPQPNPKPDPTPPEQQEYLTFDQIGKMKILSPDKVEFRDWRRTDSPVRTFKYTKEDDTLRVEETEYGATRVVTYKKVEDRLDGSDGSTFYWAPALFAATLVNFAITAEKAGKYDEGIIDCGDAIHVNPAFWRMYIERAILYQHQHQYQRALADCQKVINQRGNGLADAQNECAWILATADDESVRDGVQAVALARAACSASGNSDAHALDTLAAAFAETAQFAAAIKTEQDAIKINADASETDDMQRRLDLYTKHIPFRDSPAE